MSAPYFQSKIQYEQRCHERINVTATDGRICEPASYLLLACSRLGASWTRSLTLADLLNKVKVLAFQIRSIMDCSHEPIVQPEFQMCCASSVATCIGCHIRCMRQLKILTPYIWGKVAVAGKE